MIPFFRENQPYFLEDILNQLSVSKKDRQNVKDILLDFDILKRDCDENHRRMYHFSYVGIFEVCGYVGCCYPKFFRDRSCTHEQFKQLIRVITKYNSEKGVFADLAAGHELSENSYSKILTELYLFNDFIENGVYTNQNEFLEENGDGEIDWDDTVNSIVPVVQNCIPHYVNLKTKVSMQEENVLSRLHKCVVTLCSKHLKKCGLLDYLSMDEIVESEENLFDFGDISYVEHILRTEISTQFATRKQIVLKTMLSYIQEENSLRVSNSIFLYGIRDFNKIWECTCASLVGNLYEKILRTKDKIFKSIWFYDFGDGEKQQESSNIIPDILSRHEKTFFILDAKNFNIDYDGKRNRLVNVPGMQDIVKQFVYHKVLLEYVYNEGIDKVVNALLFPKLFDGPSQTVKVEKFGRVEMPSLTEWAGLRLVPINLLYLDVESVFDFYLLGKKNKDILSLISYYCL